MKGKLKKEIEQMIKAETEVLAVTEGQYVRHVDRFSHTEVIWLILSHLGLELNIKCRHPQIVLESTAKKEKK